MQINELTNHSYRLNAIWVNFSTCLFSNLAFTIHTWGFGCYKTSFSLTQRILFGVSHKSGIWSRTCSCLLKSLSCSFTFEHCSIINMYIVDYTVGIVSDNLFTWLFWLCQIETSACFLVFPI